jgi:hypothetical protein
MFTLTRARRDLGEAEQHVPACLAERATVRERAQEAGAVANLATYHAAGIS